MQENLEERKNIVKNVYFKKCGKSESKKAQQMQDCIQNTRDKPGVLHHHYAYLVFFAADDELREFKSGAYSPSDWRQGTPRGVGGLRRILSSQFLETKFKHVSVL